MHLLRIHSKLLYIITIIVIILSQPFKTFESLTSSSISINLRFPPDNKQPFAWAIFVLAKRISVSPPPFSN